MFSKSDIICPEYRVEKESSKICSLLVTDALMMPCAVVVELESKECQLCRCGFALSVCCGRKRAKNFNYAVAVQLLYLLCYLSAANLTFYKEQPRRPHKHFMYTTTQVLYSFKFTVRANHVIALVCILRATDSGYIYLSLITCMQMRYTAVVSFTVVDSFIIFFFGLADVIFLSNLYDYSKCVVATCLLYNM